MNSKQLLGALGIIVTVIVGVAYVVKEDTLANQRNDIAMAKKQPTKVQQAPVAGPGSNQAFCGGVLNAVAVGMESYAPGMSRQHEDFARDRIDRASQRGLSDSSINYFFGQGFKKMRELQAANSDQAFDLMQECLRLQ